MNSLTINPAQALQGQIRIPGDKSISHRALILGALAAGKNRLRGWLEAGDTLATLKAMRSLGIDVKQTDGALTFSGGKLTPPDAAIDCANAGTAMRLLAGLLAGQPFPSTLDGSEQLRARPIRRVVEPLQAMGAAIQDTEGCAPLYVKSAQLIGKEHHLPVASAQVKSALLLAGLQAEGETMVMEPAPSRDHTERMLAAMGAPIAVVDGCIRIRGLAGAPIEPLDIDIAGDFSSAAFLIVAAAILPGSDVLIANVGLNPTRTGLLDILDRMGAKITVEDQRNQDGEAVGTLRVLSGPLMGTEIGGEDIVRAIDEIPILAVAATQAEGETRISGASELRVKEVDRIALLAQELRAMGAEIQERPDGMLIRGPTTLHGTRLASHGDHRLAMALAVAGLLAAGETRIEGTDCIADSFPGFAATLARLGAEIS